MPFRESTNVQITTILIVARKWVLRESIHQLGTYPFAVISLRWHSLLLQPPVTQRKKQPNPHKYAKLEA